MSTRWGGNFCLLSRRVEGRRALDVEQSDYAGVQKLVYGSEERESPEPPEIEGQSIILSREVGRIES